jgi:hypothetical protein
MLAGLPPFYNGASASLAPRAYFTRCFLTPFPHTGIIDKMYKKILRDALLFPDEVSPSARSILTGLLTRDLAKSQGVNCGGYVLREDHLLAAPRAEDPVIVQAQRAQPCRHVQF